MQARIFHFCLIALASVLWASSPLPAEEPNDDYTSADPIACLTVQEAEIGAPDVDYYRIQGPAGTGVNIDIDAAEMGSSLDSYLGVFDLNHVLLDWSDDDPAPGELLSLDSYLRTSIPPDGLLWVAVTSLGDADFDGTGGTTTGPYTLNVLCDPAPDANEPDDDFQDATILDCPMTRQQDLAIHPAGDGDTFVFTGRPGTLVVVDVDAWERGSPLDSVLNAFHQQFDLSYQFVTSSDDDAAPGEPWSRDPYLELIFPDPGIIFLEVEAYDGDGDGTGDSTGLYHLSIHCAPQPGDLLGTTGSIRALVDFKPWNWDADLRAVHSAPVADVTFLDDGTLLGAFVAPERFLAGIGPVLGIETLRCTHEYGFLGALEQVDSTLYASFGTSINGPSSLVTVEDPVDGSCALTELAPTGFGLLGGLAYHPAQHVLYGCVGRGNGSGDLIVCDPEADPACTSVGPTGFWSCTALEFGPDGTLYGGVGYDSSEDSGKLIVIDPATGAATETGPAPFWELSGLAFVPLPPDPREDNNRPQHATPIACPSFRSQDAALDPWGDVDYYRLTGAPLSQVSIDLDSTGPAWATNSVLGAFDSELQQLAFSDDDAGPEEYPSLDSYLEVTLPADGVLILAVSAFPDADFLGDDAASSGPYTLEVICDPFEPNDSLEQAMTVHCGDRISASIDPLGDVDYYWVVDTSSFVRADIDADEEGSGLDSVLAAFDYLGYQWDFSDNDPAPGELYSADSYFAVDTYPFTTYLAVSSVGDVSFDGGPDALTTGPYHLSVDCGDSCVPPAEICGPEDPPLLVRHANPSGKAELVFPSAGGGYEVHILGVDIHRAGLDLTSAPGATPVDKLQNRLTYLQFVGETATGPMASFVDEIYSLAPGEVMGYLPMTESDCDVGVFGPLGQGRGSTDPGDLSYPSGDDLLRCTCIGGSIIDSCLGIDCEAATALPLTLSHMCSRICLDSGASGEQGWVCTPGTCGGGS